MFIHAERAPAAGDDGPPWPDVAGRMQARLGRLYPRAFFDSRHDSVRALAPLPTGDREATEGCAGPARSWLATRACRSGSATSTAAPRAHGAASGGCRRRRIGRSLAGAGGATQYEQLGAYRYLVHLDPGDAPRDRFGQAVDQLVEYDERRKAQLVETLERFLGARCSVAGTAARSSSTPTRSGSGSSGSSRSRASTCARTTCCRSSLPSRLRVGRGSARGAAAIKTRKIR